MSQTFYWHDYETFGIHPAIDRPVQFAGLRTDPDLREVGEAMVLYCRPPPDYLPDPSACLITGITPQIALERGVTESDFIARIHEQLALRGTCGVGYNSIRFDDEFTRHLLWRNFYDPYEREYRNGNSRWDLIDVLRMARALRPEGIDWPDHADGRPSFKLEDLTRANRIEHSGAHDALVDTRATLELARRLRQSQPRLFEHALLARDKNWVKHQLNIIERKPMLHFSSRFPAENGNAAVVAPLAIHPLHPNAIIVCNLLLDPAPLLHLSADELRTHLYTPSAELPAGATRVPLKEVHVNRSPMLAPLTLLTPALAARFSIDIAACHERLALLHVDKRLVEKIRAIYTVQREASQDPELSLYSGGFLDDRDRRLVQQVRAADAKSLTQRTFAFADVRLAELLFRYRARNFPETLAAAERAEWVAHCRVRLQAGIGPYRERIAELRAAAADTDILDALQRYGTLLCEQMGEDKQ